MIRMIDKRSVLGLVAGGVLLAPWAVSAGGPIGATLQTQGAAGEAVAGVAGGPAVISVVVTRQNSRPATNLGVDGPGLPLGWALVSDFNVPPGDPTAVPPTVSCPFVPVSFDNHDNGVYTIGVLPDATGTPGCTWVSGEYHYAIGLHKTKGHGKHKAASNITGTTLGSLVIP
ncbi:MAG: hypothetical protein ACREWG_04870 [Gammaproteobacteria bacterium]